MSHSDGGRGGKSLQDTDVFDINDLSITYRVLWKK